MVETWKTVPYAPLYEVSDQGRVRSLPRVITRPHKSRPHNMVWRGGELAPWLTWQNGRPLRCRVALRVQGRTLTKLLHHVVLETFVGPRPEGLQCCHNDGNPFNNKLSNLRWDTAQSNHDDMLLHGTRKKPPIRWGERHHHSTISDTDVAYIRSLPYRRGLYTQLASKFNVSITTIGRLHKRKVRVQLYELVSDSEAICGGN